MNRSPAEMPPALQRLAERLGIVAAYWDLTGTLHITSAETARLLCAAMGHDASDESAAAGALARLDAERLLRRIEPVQVLREHARMTPTLVMASTGAGSEIARLRIDSEHGCEHELELPVPSAPPGRIVGLPLPRLASGDYRLELSLTSFEAGRSIEQRLVIAPRSALTFRERIGDKRARGLWANLYSVRSDTNWGFGDLGDLHGLVGATARAGGDFVGINPLHASPNRRGSASPYSPISRLYRNPLYIAVDRVPEVASADGLRARWSSAPVSRALARLRAGDRIDYEAVVSLKLDFLRELFRHFENTPAESSRRQRYAAYREREGARLVDFATFEVLMANPDGSADGTAERSSDFWSWPEPLRDPRSPAVARFRSRHAPEIEFRCWLQFEIEEQLAGVAAHASELGARIGLYGDLAVGCAAGSADEWAAPDLFARGVCVGAPPDAFAAEGQNWGLPPLDPQRLRLGGHRAFSRLLDASMRCAGALRIDHVMGFARQFWIPEGQPASAGAYVRYPLSELLGLVALASRRHGTLVIGEDLGTVPPSLPAELASWGVLSSCVLLFERNAAGFRPPEALSHRALASVNTHDLAPLAGYVSGRDLELRRACGALDGAALSAALADRQLTVESLLDRLRSEGLLGEKPPAPGDELHRLLAAFLERSPAPLVAESLDDLAGETEPINLPGIASDIHPSWERRMSATVSDLQLAKRLWSLGSDATANPALDAARRSGSGTTRPSHRGRRQKDRPDAP